MEVVIKRTYHPNGTNGVLTVDGDFLCHTIELPWLNNQRRVSCIPEGIYALAKRTSQKYGRHIHVQNVPGRTWILIHPANTASTELMGCIAPVTRLTGPGRGTRSRIPTEQLRDLVYAAIDRGETVTLTIAKNG